MTSTVFSQNERLRNGSTVQNELDSLKQARSMPQETIAQENAFMRSYRWIDEEMRQEIARSVCSSL